MEHIHLKLAKLTPLASILKNHIFLHLKIAEASIAQVEFFNVYAFYQYFGYIEQT